MNYFTKHIYRLVPILFLVAISYSSQAQSLSQTVIGSAGSFTPAPSGAPLHWTVGEVAVQTFEGTNILSEGFHQMYYDLLFTPLWEVNNQIELKLFPNPTAGWLRLENESGASLNIVVSNLLGQHILSTTTDQFQHDFDLAVYPDGLYLFSVHKNGQLIKTFKINKQRN